MLDVTGKPYRAILKNKTKVFYVWVHVLDCACVTCGGVRYCMSMCIFEGHVMVCISRPASFWNVALTAFDFFVCLYVCLFSLAIRSHPKKDNT